MIFLSVSCFSVFLHYPSFDCHFSSLYFDSEITYFYIKYFALPYNIDVVSTLLYYINNHIIVAIKCFALQQYTEVV